MALTPEQVRIVKSTAPIIKEHGQTVTTTFYRNLLTAHPELRSYFSVRNQQTGAQQAALARSVLAYATYIDDLGRLSPAVERIAQKHASLFIKAEHYPIVGQFLIGAFAEVLGEGLTPDVRDAWVAAYGQLADVFIQREKQLYDEAGEWQSWRRFRIARKEAETPSVVNLYLEPEDGAALPPYRPGQYVNVQLPIPQLDGLPQSRQFSLSEAPSSNGPQRHYRISVKREEASRVATRDDMAAGKVAGLVSSMLHDECRVGDEVELSPPRGEFCVDPVASGRQANALVLLSAGVGAAPLVAILDAVLDSPSSTRPIRWICTASSPESVCFAAHIKDVAGKHANVTSTTFVKQGAAGHGFEFEGRMTPERLGQEGLLPLDEADAEYYLCGPEEWMMELRSWLESKGVERSRQHLELFKTGDVD